jgi:hypothetical protein
MNELISANREVATLETAPTRYVEGGGVRFAYRQLRRPEPRWCCCSTSQATSTPGTPPS